MFLVLPEGFSHEENTSETFHNVNYNIRSLSDEKYMHNQNMEEDNKFENSSGSKLVGAQSEKHKRMRKGKQIYFFTLLQFRIISFPYLSGILCCVHFLSQSYHWVTGSREWGSVRGSALE